MRQGPAAMAQQDAQELELDRREVDLLVLAPYHAGREVDLQAVDREPRLGVMPLGAPQHRAQAGHELARRERLDDVVVGAGLQRLDLLVLGIHGGQDDQRHLTPLAHAAADVGAVAVGSSRLDDDGVGHAQRRTVERIGRSARHVHVEPGGP